MSTANLTTSHDGPKMPQSFGCSMPPVPPPKPSSQGVSRRGTPTSGQALPSPPSSDVLRTRSEVPDELHRPEPPSMRDQHLLDPGDRWLPGLLENKSKQDLADILGQSVLLSALTNAQSATHASTVASKAPLQAALAENITFASHLNELEARLTHLRGSTQTQLLSTHALERQWRQKQSDMDRALAPFSPSSLYQRLSQGVQEQEMVCRAMEESFLDADGTVATEREITEWSRRYRDAKKLYYSRRERKERWDEGRVGGWR